MEGEGWQPFHPCHSRRVVVVLVDFIARPRTLRESREGVPKGRKDLRGGPIVRESGPPDGIPFDWTRERARKRGKTSGPRLS